MRIDFHCHWGVDDSGEGGEKMDFEKMKDRLHEVSISRAVVFPFNRADDLLIEDSVEILEKSKTESWIIPFLRFNPNTIIREKLESLLQLGFKGIKLHPRAQDFCPDNKEFYWIYELCQEKKIPILFHSSEADKNSRPKFIINVAKSFPGLNVVMAHFFGGKFGYIDEAIKCPNLYVDTSIHSGTLKRLQAVQKHKFDRLLFASDFPYDDPVVSLLKIMRAGYTESEKEGILYKNALKVLGELE